MSHFKMSYRWLVAFAAGAFLVLFLIAGSVPAGDKMAPIPLEATAAGYLPDDLLAVMVLREPDHSFETIRTYLEERGFQDSRFYQALSSDPKTVQFRTGLLGLAEATDMDLWKGISTFLGKDTIIGLKPGKGEEPQVVGVSRARNPEALIKIFEVIHKASGLGTLESPNPERCSRVEGHQVYSKDGTFFHCLVDNAVVFSNRMELMKAALSARADKKGRLCDCEFYRKAVQAVPEDAAAWACLDMTALRKIMTLAGKPLPDRLSDPMGGLLFGAWQHQILNGDRILAWVRTAGDHDGIALKVDFRVEGSGSLPAEYQGFLSEGTGPIPCRLEALPRFIGTLSVSRGWADLLEERESLYDLNAAGKIVNFAGVLTTLMGGYDFMDEFLPRISGPVSLVAARRDYGRDEFEAVPKLPAFALVAGLDRSEDKGLNQRLHTAFTMILSFVNFQAAQEKKPALLIDTAEYQDTAIIRGAYPKPDPGPSGLVEVRYNFAPAAAVVKDHLILGTTDGMVRDLIDLLNGEDTAKTVARSGASARARLNAASTDRIHIDGSELKTILMDNRAQLVADRMIKEDESETEAEAVMDILFELMDHFRFITVRSRTLERGSRVELEVGLHDAANVNGAASNHEAAPTMERGGLR